MSDTYQAVYDAVRSRVGSIDGQTIARAIADKIDISYEKALVAERIVDEFQEALSVIAQEVQRPCVLFKPVLSRYSEDSPWDAKYGGVVGSGPSPAEAMTAFDKAWNGQ